jgi:hypothetical protein
LGTPDKDRKEEAELANLAKRTLAMPPKPRDESKSGKPRAMDGKSPAKRTAGKGRGRVGKSKR